MRKMKFIKCVTMYAFDMTWKFREIYGGEAGKFGWINKLLISWYMIEAILFRDFYLIPIGLSHSATLTHCWFGMDFL